MRSEAIFSGVSFTISELQVSCGIDEGLLKIKVTASESMKPAQLFLSKVATEGNIIELAIAQSQSSPAPFDVWHNINPSSSQQPNLSHLQQRLNSLETTIRQLEDRLISKS